MDLFEYTEHGSKPQSFVIGADLTRVAQLMQLVEQ